MELYLPPSNAKIPKSSDFYRATERFRRRSEASRANALRYWSDPENRRRVCLKTAKPVDAFRADGSYVGTYPSALKAAESLITGTGRISAAAAIRAVRRGAKRSYKGLMFRDARPEKKDIAPMPPRRHKARGYHVRRGPDTYAFARKPVTAVSGGLTVSYPSVGEFAAAIGLSRTTVWNAARRGRPVNGWTVSYDYKPNAKIQAKRLENKTRMGTSNDNTTINPNNNPKTQQ